MPLDLSTTTTPSPLATWWECPACGDYAWLEPDEEPPSCSCDGDDDEM